MPVRRLSPEERALWAKVVASVTPLHAKAEPPPEAEVVADAPAPQKPRVAAAPPKQQRAAAKPVPGMTLDGSWDRRLSRGLVQPDVSLDLHGHNLATAYSLLDERLERAIASGARVMLLVTGKAPKGEPPIERGRIRAAVGDWLGASRHAGDIAAVRNAHPRHGGAGALYIILRRRK
ncbi:MAG TPA: Smr/MutS family protein [Allosphingosinicella sp.]|nr:Smr/MutS family protein [Allosphingosinicella sp.]